MKKTLIGLSIVSIAGTLTFSACKKSNPSAQSKFVGTWKMHQMVVDTNNNKTLDVNDETIIVDSLDFIVKFNSNGTGSSSSGSGGGGGTFTWTLAMNNTYIAITDSGSTTASYMQITSQPGSSFTIADTSQSPMAWETFNKQ